MAFSPAGAYLASGGGDNQVFVWRSNLDALEQRLGRDQENVRDVEVVAEQVDAARRQVQKADALAEKVQNRHVSHHLSINLVCEILSFLLMLAGVWQPSCIC